MTLEQVLGVVRALAAALGGYLVGKGLVDDATVVQLTGAAVTVVSAAWSIYSNRASKLT